MDQRSTSTTREVREGPRREMKESQIYPHRVYFQHKSVVELVIQLMINIINCTTEALEIKGAANSVGLRRIVVLCGLGVYGCGSGVYGCGLGVYGCGLGVYGVRFRSVWVSPRILWYKPVTLHPLYGLVDTLNRFVGVM